MEVHGRSRREVNHGRRMAGISQLVECEEQRKGRLTSPVLAAAHPPVHHSHMENIPEPEVGKARMLCTVHRSSQMRLGVGT